MPVEQSEPAPWVGWTATKSSIGRMTSWSERYIWWANGTAFSSPSRSVRPTAPTSSEPPLKSASGSSARVVSASAYATCSGVCPGVSSAVNRRRPDLERGAVGQAAMLVAQLGAGPDDVGRAGQGRELAAAGDVVVVEVRLDHADDPQIVRPGGLEVDVDVPTWIDHRRHACVVVGDQGRQVAEAADRELLDTHRRGA